MSGSAYTPAVAVGPGIPSSTEEGSLFSREFFMPHAAPRSMKIASPLGQGGTSGGF